MYQHILIATDGSELGNKAVAHGIALAKDLKVPVSIVTVTKAWSSLDLAHMARLGNQNPISQYEEMASAAADNILENAAQVAKLQGVTCDVIHVPDQQPAEGI